MLVIGIDPGTAITGYGLVREEENGKLNAVDYGPRMPPVHCDRMSCNVINAVAGLTVSAVLSLACASARARNVPSSLQRG